MRAPIRIGAGLAMASALAFLVACATTAAPRIDDTAWRLSGWSVSSLDARDFPITARFADGRVSGRSAVNTYTGTATPGPGNAIAFGPLATTRMAGPEPAMRAEGLYLGLLAGVKSYRLADGQLTLLDGNGNASLVFAPSTE